MKIVLTIILMKNGNGVYHKRKEAHKIIRNKKMTCKENVIESIEDQKHSNTKKCIKQ